MIKCTDSKLHWNYFLALERDLESVARYIEFTEANLKTFSIELAHLLFAAASEVDVVAKLYCKALASGARRENINHYRSVITKSHRDFALIQISIPRYGLTLTPWENWSKGTSPDWWRSYNNVKHERDKHFQEATLQNTFNAMGALLIITFHYYHSMASFDTHRGENLKGLQPQPALLGFTSPEYYFPYFA